MFAEKPLRSVLRIEGDKGDLTTILLGQLVDFGTSTPDRYVVFLSAYVKAQIILVELKTTFHAPTLSCPSLREPNHTIFRGV